MRLAERCTGLAPFGSGFRIARRPTSKGGVSSMRVHLVSVRSETTRCKHYLLLADIALVGSAGIHHVEYFELIRDEFIVRHRTVAVRVDLVH